MKCPNCGNEFKENKNFCTNCGVKLGMNNIQDISNKKIHISLKRIIIIISIILFTLFIIAIIVQLSTSSKPVIENENIVEEQQLITYTPNQAGIFRNEANVIEEKFDKNNNMTYYKTKNDNGTFNEETFTYQYDEQNRLTRMTNSKDEYITIDYNEKGQISSTTNSNGITTNYFYNNDNELSYKVESSSFKTIYCYKTYKDNENEYVLERCFDNAFTTGGFKDRGYKIYRKSDLNTSNFSNAFQFMQLAIVLDYNFFLGYDNLYSINYNMFPFSNILGYKTTLKSFSVNYDIFDNFSIETTKTEKYFDKEHRILKEEKTDDTPKYYQYEKISNNEILQKYLFETVDIDTDNPVYCEYKIKYYYENNSIVKKEFISMNENLTKTEYEELKKDYIKYFNENVDITDYGDIEGYSSQMLSYDRILDLYVDNEENDINSIENSDTDNSNSSQQTNISSNNSNSQTNNKNSTSISQSNVIENEQSTNNSNTNVDTPSTPFINEIGHNINTNLSTGEKTASIYIYARDEKDDNLTVTVNGEKVNYSINSCVYKTQTLKTGTNTFNIVITNKYGKSISRTYTIEI